MRLIDADRLMVSLRGNVLIDVTTELEETIAQQPTAFGDGKGIIVMDNPKNCGECRFYRQFVGFAQSCVISGRDVDSRCKPSWCPIKQVSNSERGMKAWED